MATLVLTEPELLCEHYLSPQHLHAIGVVTAEWSLLELNLRHEVAALVDLRGGVKGVVAITNAAGARELAQTIRNLLDLGYLEDEQAGAVRAALERVDQLAPLRNEIVHAAWAATMLPAGSLHVFPPVREEATGVHASGRGASVRTITLTPKEIRQVALDTQEIRYAITHKRRPRPSAALASQRERLSQGNRAAGKKR